uniref:PRA1 family protein n=1 Tax=Cyprinodon variegatus TaxID=28743 RepID=A0A3Q2GPB5_CYPVA
FDVNLIFKMWSDFFPGLKGFAFPNNFREFEERLISNLLYYQTNYLVLGTAVFILAGYVKCSSQI